jgi:hypothetical protein
MLNVNNVCSESAPPTSRTEHRTAIQQMSDVRRQESCQIDERKDGDVFKEKEKRKKKKKKKK